MGFLFKYEEEVVDLDELRNQIKENIKSHKTRYLIQGIFFILVSLLAFILPYATAISMSILVGALLMITGAVQLFTSKIHASVLFSSLLSIIAGAIMLFQPVIGVIALVTLVAIFLTIEGIFEIVFALKFRLIRHWWWMLFAGIITLGLAILLWLNFPYLGVIFLSWIIALNFLMYGISLLMLVREATKA